mmetsp:Transcript_4978/g.6751  ORF Transcript_4978/g.6751 Transcript_4978/m.6751 type:complete len:158 (-) Transcript_4978:361-834(-)
MSVLKLMKLVVAYIIVEAVGASFLNPSFRGGGENLVTKNRILHSRILPSCTQGISIGTKRAEFSLRAANDLETEIVELVDDEEEQVSKGVGSVSQQVAPFLSQGEILEETLTMSNDPKQTRVIAYIVISLIPVLFLIPLMLGSRDLIPLEALPPVEM